MARVCLDNHVLLWGIKEIATPGQEAMIQTAKDLIADLDKRKVDVVIPTVVLAEFLMPIPQKEQPMAINLMTKSFKTVSFCNACSLQFAKVWSDRQQKGIVTELKDGEKLSKHDIKFDCLIVAVALQENVDIIYSNDRQLARFAKGLVEVKAITSEPRQQNLF